MKSKLLGAVLAAGLVLGVASSASAGICDVTLDTTWSASGSTISISDTSFNACNTASVFAGTRNSNSDTWAISLIAVDNDTLGLSIEVTDAGNSGAPLSSFDISVVISNITWLGMNGIITGVIDNSIPTGSGDLDVSSFTNDSITLTATSSLGQNGCAGGPGCTVLLDLGTFDIVAQHVPEPGTLALFGLGLAGLGVARRRKAT